MAKFSNRITDVTYTLASATSRGLVGIDAQTFAGDKTFTGNLLQQAASSGAAASGTANNLVLENSGAAGLSILTGGTSLARIAFGDSGDAVDGRIDYDQNTRQLSFGTASVADKMVLDANGNLGIGTTSPGAPLQVTNGTVAGQPTWASADIGIFSGDSAVTTASILQIHQENANGICGIQFSQGAERGNGYIRFENASGTGNLQLIVDSNNALEINSLGAVSLGTTGQKVNFRSPTATTVGATGAASALPANPLGYLRIEIGGTEVKVPYYNI